MEPIKYLDFDLLIEKAHDRYRARVLQSPAGQASAEFILPFTDQDIEILMLRVGRNRRGVRRIESPEMQAAKQFGGKLFDAVFSNEVRGALRSSVDTASREGAGLRVRLRLGDVPELTDLPWEYLYNASLNRFLALSNKSPLVRYIELPETPRPLKIAPPLRVLVMISSPNDYDPLDVEREWQKLQNALRELRADNMVTLERLEAATLGALRRKLRQGQYHVLHFIGHGGFDTQSQDGVLILEDEQKRGRRTSGQYLAQVLMDHESLRLVILNACEGARTARNDPFAGVAQSLVQQGIPGVIAMQFEITDEASITFAHEFYAAIADGYPVDAALSDARSAIFSEVNDLEWGTPVLYLRAPDGMIFAPLTPEERARERQAMERRTREQEQRIESLYLAAQIGLAQNDFDAAENSLAALLAMGAENENTRTLQKEIQDGRARHTAGIEQERQAAEQAQHIESLYLGAQASFEKQEFDDAEASLAALLALDAEHVPARELQEQISTARAAQAAPTELYTNPPAQTTAPPPGIPERAYAMAAADPAPTSSVGQGFPARYALPLAGAIILLLLLLGGGALALGIFNSSSPTPTAQIVLPASTTTGAENSVPTLDLSGAAAAAAQQTSTRIRQQQAATQQILEAAAQKTFAAGQSNTRTSEQRTLTAAAQKTRAASQSNTVAAVQRTATAATRKTLAAVQANAQVAATTRAEQTKTANAAAAARARQTQIAAANNCTSPSPPIPSNWRLDVCDTFNSNVNNWDIGEFSSGFGSGNYRIENGKYVMSYAAKAGVIARTAPQGLSSSDLYLAVMAQVASGGATSSQYGLYFRSDGSNYYILQAADSQRFSVYLRMNGEWIELLPWQDAPGIRPGQANRLAVLAQGSHFTFFINDVKVGEIENDQLASGSVGVSISLDADGDQATFEYDNFELWSP